jgi:DNA-binding protein H-NS
VSTAACDQARETLASVTAKTAELEETAAQLRRQLDELVEAKKSDEEELLVKFRDLLNEKKVKIREQTALLAAASREANPEPVKFEAVSEDEAPAPKTKSKAKAKPKAAPARKPGTSRAAKRKQPVKDEEETEEEEEAEQMDIDPPAKESPVEVSDEDRNTTDAETETASEGEEEDVPAAPAPAVKLKSPAQPAKPATRARGTRAASKQPGVAPQAATDSAGSTQEAMPPKRELPFGRRRAAPVPAKKATPPPAGDETESEDEL